LPLTVAASVVLSPQSMTAVRGASPGPPGSENVPLTLKRVLAPSFALVGLTVGVSITNDAMVIV